MDSCQCYLDHKGRHCLNPAKGGSIYCYLHPEGISSVQPKTNLGPTDRNIVKSLSALDEIRKSLRIAWVELSCCGSDITKAFQLPGLTESQRKVYQNIVESYSAMKQSISQIFQQAQIDQPEQDIDNSIFTPEYYNELKEIYAQEYSGTPFNFLSYPEYFESEFAHLYMPLIDAFYDNYLIFYKRVQARLSWLKLPRYNLDVARQSCALTDKTKCCDTSIQTTCFEFFTAQALIRLSLPLDQLRAYPSIVEYQQAKQDQLAILEQLGSSVEQMSQSFFGQHKSKQERKLYGEPVIKLS